MFITLNEYVFLDVSGGINYSMLDEMRSALEVSNSLSFTKENYTPLSYKDVFNMATLGGAKGKVGYRILEMLFISIYKTLIIIDILNVFSTLN